MYCCTTEPLIYLIRNLFVPPISVYGPGSSVGIATDYGLDGPGSNPGGAHPASCKMGTGSFSGVNCGRGVLLTTHPLLVPRLWKSRPITTHHLGHTGPLTGTLYLYRYLLVFIRKVSEVHAVFWDGVMSNV